MPFSHLFPPNIHQAWTKCGRLSWNTCGVNLGPLQYPTGAKPGPAKRLSAPATHKWSGKNLPIALESCKWHHLDLNSSHKYIWFDYVSLGVLGQRWGTGKCQAYPRLSHFKSCLLPGQGLNSVEISAGKPAHQQTSRAKVSVLFIKVSLLKTETTQKTLLENCTYGSTDFRRRIEHENASTRQPTRDWGAQCFFQCRGSVIGVAGNRACAKSASSLWKSGRPTGAERRRKLATFYLARFTWHDRKLSSLDPANNPQHTQRLPDRFAKQGFQQEHTTFWGSSHRPSQPCWRHQQCTPRLVTDWHSCGTQMIKAQKLSNALWNFGVEIKVKEISSGPSCPPSVVICECRGSIFPL